MKFNAGILCISQLCEPRMFRRPVCRPAPITIYPATDVKGPVNTIFQRYEMKSACRVAF